MADPDYFTLAEFRALPDCSGFTDAEINNAANYFTAIVEREVGQPFIPRTFTETLDGRNGNVVLAQPFVRTLTSITVNGVASSLTNITVRNGVVLNTSGYTVWPFGLDNVVVSYTAGRYATCPADVKDAVMWATRDRLLSQKSNSAIDMRKTSVSNEFGGITNYVLPGEKRPTGYPDLDAVIASYVRNTASLGFA